MEERGALALGIALISELCFARLPLPPLLARARVRVVLTLAVDAPRLVHREELRLALPPRLLEFRLETGGLLGGRLLLGGVELLLQLAHLLAVRLRHLLDRLLVLLARHRVVGLHRSLEAQSPPRTQCGVVRAVKASAVPLVHPLDLPPLRLGLSFRLRSTAPLGLWPPAALAAPLAAALDALAALAARHLDLARVAVWVVQVLELALLEPAEADATLLPIGRVVLAPEAKHLLTLTHPIGRGDRRELCHEPIALVLRGCARLEAVREAREGLGVRRVLIAVRRVHVHVLALMVRWVPLLLLGRRFPPLRRLAPLEAQRALGVLLERAPALVHRTDHIPTLRPKLRGAVAATALAAPVGLRRLTDLELQRLALWPYGHGAELVHEARQRSLVARLAAVPGMHRACLALEQAAPGHGLRLGPGTGEQRRDDKERRHDAPKCA